MWNKLYGYGIVVVAVLIGIIKFLLKSNKHLKEEIKAAKKSIEFREDVDDVDTEIDQQFSRRAEEARTALNNNRIPDHLR